MYTEMYTELFGVPFTAFVYLLCDPGRIRIEEGGDLLLLEAAFLKGSVVFALETSRPPCGAGFHLKTRNTLYHCIVPTAGDGHPLGHA